MYFAQTVTRLLANKIQPPHYEIDLHDYNFQAMMLVVALAIGSQFAEAKERLLQLLSVCMSYPPFPCRLGLIEE